MLSRLKWINDYFINYFRALIWLLYLLEWAQTTFLRSSWFSMPRASRRWGQLLADVQVMYKHANIKASGLIGNWCYLNSMVHATYRFPTGELPMKHFVVVGAWMQIYLLKNNNLCRRFQYAKHVLLFEEENDQNEEIARCRGHIRILNGTSRCWFTYHGKISWPCIVSFSLSHCDCGHKEREGNIPNI